jgi:hypothetical protein
MTRPPGYLLPPLPSFALTSLANINETVWRTSQQTNDNGKRTEHFGTLKTYKAIESLDTRYCPDTRNHCSAETIIETMTIVLTSS